MVEGTIVIKIETTSAIVQRSRSKVICSTTWLQGRGQPAGGAVEWRIDDSVHKGQLVSLSIMSTLILQMIDRCYDGTLLV